MHRSFTPLVLLLAAAARLACAQDYPNLVVTCIKVDPLKTAEFEKLQKDFIRPWRQVEADQGHILAWSLQRAVLPAGDDAHCDYVTTVALSSLKKVLVPGRQEQTLAAAKLPITFAEYTTAYHAIAKRRRVEVWRVVGSGGSWETGQFVRWSYAKRNDLPAFIKAYQEHIVPARDLQLKEGKLKAYTHLSLSMNAYGSPYSTLLLSSVTEFIDTQVQPYTDITAMLKKHFNKDYDTLIEKAIPIRSEVYRTIESVRPSRPASASGGAK